MTDFGEINNEIKKYIDANVGQEFGVKEIIKYLNNKGFAINEDGKKFRGWIRNFKIDNDLYKEHSFNQEYVFTSKLTSQEFWESDLVDNKYEIRDFGKPSWFGINKHKVDAFRNKFRDDFSFSITRKEDNEVIIYKFPFRFIESSLIDEYITYKSNNRQRWYGSIGSDGILKITRYPFNFDLNSFEISRLPLQAFNFIDEHYEGDNYGTGLVRKGQNKFRDKVLKRFGYKCCICGIEESDLLNASHIEPWSHNKNSRLDPLNGLCLSPLYDRLFDKGYFTIDNNLNVVVTTLQQAFSEELKRTLQEINGKSIRGTASRFKLEYFDYHRQHIFRG